MTIQDYFSKIYVIHLPRRTDRWELCKAELERCGIDRYEVFEGYDHPTDGHQGCTRSHRMLLRKIADIGAGTRYLILEDDFQEITLGVLAAGGFRSGSKVWDTFLTAPGDSVNARFDYLTPHFPKWWDVLYLGAGYGEPPISRYNQHVVRCGFMQTTSSYGITAEFAAIWTRRVDATMGTTNWDRHPGPIDNVFGGMAKDSWFYCLQPRLFFQRASKSDITGETNSYLFSMTDPAHEQMV